MLLQSGKMIYKKGKNSVKSRGSVVGSSGVGRICVNLGVDETGSKMKNLYALYSLSNFAYFNRPNLTAMQFIQQPAYLIAILLLLVVFSEWLVTKKFFRHIGSVLIVIILAAILANLGVIPSSGNAPPLYDKIFTYAAPLGIFFLLLEVRLKDLRLAGLPMLVMFLTGSLATIAGVVIGYWIFAPQQHHIDHAYAVAGVNPGTYIGGSANL